MTDDRGVTGPGTESDDRPSTDTGASVSVADNPGGVSIDRLVAELPPAIAELGAGSQWSALAVASTGVTVWRLDHRDAPRVILKVAPAAGGAAAELRAEAERLQWLGDVIRAAGSPGDVTVPEVIVSAADGTTGDQYLAMTEVDGTPASQAEVRADADTLITALATGLRWLHELPVGAAGHRSSIDDRLSLAAQRLGAGLVDPREFEPIHSRYEPERLYEHLLTMRPPGPEDPVIVHGDPSLDNTILVGGRVSGYVDLGRAGVSDRYLDLAIVARELATRVSPHALGPFFTAYGLDAPDVRKVDFFLLLDEFF
jgi:aminoglycoside phosphotransferase